jgi:hypothetical protein
MYEVLEVSLGNLSRLYQYKQKDRHGADYNIKGFDYPWLLTSREWKHGERVLDIGAAYSLLPIHIQEMYGCEVWVADDFGINSNDPFWQRGKSPQEHIATHRQVRSQTAGRFRGILPSGQFF